MNIPPMGPQDLVPYSYHLPDRLLAGRPGPAPSSHTCKGQDPTILGNVCSVHLSWGQMLLHLPSRKFNCTPHKEDDPCGHTLACSSGWCVCEGLGWQVTDT